MKDKLSAFWNGFKEKWSSIARSMRIFIITALSVVIVAAIVLTIILNQPSYTKIYTNLDSEEASQVVTAVNDMGVSDVIMGADGSISVPADKADDIRMKLSIQGYPSSSFNFDVWNNGIGMWATDTEKKVLQIQQLQTHLMKAINTIREVDNSYVIITLPDRNNYVISTNTDEPKVSVKLDLRNGSSLTSEQIKGIYALILNSLPGLEMDNISVIGTDGALLSGENAAGEEDALFKSRLNFQEQTQKLLISQIDSTMKKLFKDYTINVNVSLNYDKSKSELTIYTPTIAEDGTLGGMVEESNKTEAWGGLGELEGVVGTTGNSDISPNYPTITGDDGKEYYYQSSINVKRLVNTEIKQLEKNGYSIDRITAAVTVDKTDMLEADREQLKEIIAFAIGTDVNNVSVANYPFVINTSPNANQPVIGGTNTDWIYLLIVSMGLLVLMLLIIAMLTGGAKKKRRAKAKAQAAAAAGAERAAQAAELSFEYITREEPSPEFNIQKLDDDENDTKGVVLRREIKDFSHTNPDVVAQLIRTLMRDE